MSCDLGYLHRTPQRHHDNEEDHDKDRIQGCVLASWPNANAGAALVKEVLCVQPGLQSSGLSEAPLDLFILMKSLLVPSSVSSCQGEEGIDSEV